MKVVKVKQGQTLIDIAIQEYGSADGVFKLCLDNQLAIGGNIKVDTELKVYDNKIINQRMVNYLKQTK